MNLAQTRQFKKDVKRMQQRGKDIDKIKAVIDRLQDHDPERVAPRLWLDEFLNALCTYERTGEITSDQTSDILDDASELMEGRTYELPPERVLAVARQTGCSGYDSQYIALAKDLGLHLYTCDQRILRACPDVARACMIPHKPSTL